MGKKFFDDDGNTVESGPSSFGNRSFPNKERGRGGNFRGGQQRDADNAGGKRYYDQDSEGAPPKKFHKKSDDGEGQTQSEEKKKLYENTVDMSSYGYQSKPWQQRDRGGFSGGRGGFRGGRSSWGDRQEDNGEEGGNGGFRGGRGGRGGGFRGGRRDWGERREEENGEGEGEEGGFSGGRGGFRGGRGGGFRGGRGDGGFRGGRRDWGDRSEGDNGEEGGFHRRRRPWQQEEAEEEEQVPEKKKLLRWVNVNLRHWRIIIRNLPFKTTKEDLEKACAPFGEFTEVVLPKCKDKRFPDSCAGFGFVQYKTEEEADKGLKGLNEAKINGRKVAADWTMPKDTYETARHAEKEELARKVKVEKDENEEKKGKKKNMKVDESDEEDEEKEEDDEMDDDYDSDDEDKSDSENEDEEKSDEDEKEEDEDEDEDKKKGKMRKEDVAVMEKRVLFLRNLSYHTTDESLKEAMQKYGNVKLAIVCRYHDSDHSKGTAFVHFEKAEEAQKAIEETYRGDVEVDGRPINASLALPREEATRMDKEKHAKTTKDTRNLLLARVGVIREGTAAAAGMSKNDAMKRKNMVQSMRKKLENLHMFISPTRLAIHNLPFSLTDDKLMEMCEKAGGEGAKVIECRIWRDTTNLDDKGVARSRGYGFVAFSSHSSALACLHALNNNAETFTNERRPIVEFSIENMQALKLRESRLGAKKAAKEKREDDVVLKEVTKTTSKMLKAGMKPLPLRMNAKIRTRTPKKKDKKKGGEKKKREEKKGGKGGGENGEQNGGAKKKAGKSGKKTLAKYLSLST